MTAPLGYKKGQAYVFYSTRSGLPATVRSLRDHMRAYYISQIGGPAANIKSINDLEKQWLRLVITTNGGTPNSQYLSALWTQAVQSKSYPVAKNIEQNQMVYWTLTTSANGL